MGRPVKNTADYFMHNANMYNHRKIKALRSNFGAIGYALWCMILEHLSASENNRFTIEGNELAFLAGDFGADRDTLGNVIEKCIEYGLLFKDGVYIYSKSLNEKLSETFNRQHQFKGLKKSRKSHIYLFYDVVTGLHKIGESINPVFREKTLRSETPKIINIFVSPITDASEEKTLHKKFHEKRKRGEWFNLNQEDVDFIKNYNYTTKA